MPLLFVLVALLLLSGPELSAQAVDPAALKPGRAPTQPVDEEYTKKILEYTTEKFFLSPLVDYLPASALPTPKAVLGDIAGAKNYFPYSKEVYAYMRLLEKSTPRVKVFSIGRTEEGREMIAVAVASESLMAKLDENRAKLAKLADPRSIGMNDAEAARIVSEVAPVYYITGTIHSTESGAPTALMELAYRLAADESPYVRHIRNNLVTLITPVVEVDGRDRMVDLFRWHMAHPGETVPPLLYWGHYVAHDNNRDAMALTLKLSQNVLDTYLSQQAQVLHDLHESVAYLYDNTVGDGPFNAWIDPLLTNEWQMIGWHNVQEMTRFGMPGVFAHGNFDTWSPGYLMFLAAMHNGISRLYETFGNGGADTEERTLRPNEYARTWFKQNPPPVRDVRQWRHRRDARADAGTVRYGADVVPAESRAATRHVVAPQQQQLRADRAPRLAQLLRHESASLPPELLREEQALGVEGPHRRAGRLRVQRRGSTARRAGRAAAGSPKTARRNFARGRAIFCERSCHACQSCGSPGRAGHHAATGSRNGDRGQGVPCGQLHRAHGPALFARG